MESDGARGRCRQDSASREGEASVLLARCIPTALCDKVLYKGRLDKITGASHKVCSATGMYFDERLFAAAVADVRHSAEPLTFLQSLLFLYLHSHFIHPRTNTEA